MFSQYHLPESEKAAAALLSRSTAILAGGTMPFKTMPPGTERLVSLRLAGLDYIRADKAGLHIGAAAVFSDIAKSKAAAWAGGIMARASDEVSSQLIRNMATAGGNMARPLPWNHLPPVFAALEAKARVICKGKAAWHPAQSLAERPLAQSLGSGALITEFLIPPAAKNMRGAFVKFGKTASSWECYALLAAVFSVKGGKFRAVRLALGGATARVVRLRGAERALEGAPAREASAGLAAAASLEGVEGLTPSHGSPEYKREIIPELVRRAVTEAL